MATRLGRAAIVSAATLGTAATFGLGVTLASAAEPPKPFDGVAGLTLSVLERGESSDTDVAVNVGANGALTLNVRRASGGGDLIITSYGGATFRYVDGNISPEERPDRPLPWAFLPQGTEGDFVIEHDAELTRERGGTLLVAAPAVVGYSPSIVFNGPGDELTQTYGEGFTGARSGVARVILPSGAEVAYASPALSSDQRSWTAPLVDGLRGGRARMSLPEESREARLFLVLSGILFGIGGSFVASAMALGARVLWSRSSAPPQQRGQLPWPPPPPHQRATGLKGRGGDAPPG